jgi:hypothetical protein
LSRNVKVKIYKTIILPVVLCGCETWSVTLREKHRLTVFENKVLRRIFGPKRDEVTGEWRKFNNGELHNLHSSPDINRHIKSWRMRSAGHVARMGEERKVNRVLVGKPEAKNHLEDQGVDGRMGSKWTLGRWDGGCGVDSLGSGPLAGCCECGDEPPGSGTTELVSSGSYFQTLMHVQIFACTTKNSINHSLTRKLHRNSNCPRTSFRTEG